MTCAYFSVKVEAGLLLVKFLRTKDTISDVLDRCSYFSRQVVFMQKAYLKHSYSIKSRKLAILAKILPYLSSYTEHYFIRKSNPTLKAISLKVAFIDKNI